MASRKTVYYDTYVEGNTVRTVEVLPDEDRARQERRRRRAQIHTQERTQARSIAHTLYALAFTAVMGLFVFCCIQYLQFQSRVTASVKNINEMESTLSDLKAENDAEYNRVMSSVDLESIRQIATDELGMVYAQEDQVVEYDSKDTDYVRQYQDVPDTSSDTALTSKAAALLGK